MTSEQIVSGPPIPDYWCRNHDWHLFCHWADTLGRNAAYSLDTIAEHVLFLGEQK